MLYSTSVSIMHKWFHSEPGEEHIQAYFSALYEEDMMIGIERTNP